MRSDEDIKQDILDEVDWDRQIASTDIGVTVKEGAVSLYGSVSSYAEKLAAERAARRVKGVRAIAEEIKVNYPPKTIVSDEDIADRVAQLFDWHSSFQENDVKAEVRNGYVTLTGEVDWHYQRETARNQVASIRGVTGVSNQIKLRPKASAADVKRKITAALHRNANVEASHINVDVSGGEVTINGDVKAWYERKLVEDAVWSAPGVVSVKDKLRVS